MKSVIYRAYGSPLQAGKKYRLSGADQVMDNTQQSIVEHGAYGVIVRSQDLVPAERNT